jgi:hypothetical protein
MISGDAMDAADLGKIWKSLSGNNLREIPLSLDLLAQEQQIDLSWDPLA